MGETITLIVLILCTTFVVTIAFIAFCFIIYWTHRLIDTSKVLIDYVKHRRSYKKWRKENNIKQITFLKW